MSLRHKKQIIKDRSGDGGLTIHYMNRNEFEACYQQSALDRTQTCAQETTIKEQKELIAALQKSLEDKTRELKISQSSSREANDHRTLLVAQHTQLEKDRDELKRDITALEDSHKSEVEALQQEAKAAEKKATDELEESRASNTQMKTNLEQQIYDLKQQKKKLNEQAQTLQEGAQAASESMKSLEQSHQILEESNKKIQQSHTTLGQYIQGQNAEIQAKTNALAKSKMSHVQLSREHKKLQDSLESATDMIDTRTSRITQLEKQYIERGEALIAATEKIRSLCCCSKEQQESSTAKYSKLESKYKLLENDNKVKNDEVQSLKKEVCEFKTRIDLKMKVLLEKHQSISQQYENQLSESNNSVTTLQKEKQTKELEVERMKAQVKELAEDNQSQVKINTSLQCQLNVASDCKNAMQERINLLEKNLQKATRSSNNDKLSKTTSGDDIVDVKSSEGKGSVDAKTKASKVEPTTAATLDEVPQNKKEDQKTSLKSAQANTLPRSPLSNVGNRQSANSSNGTTAKQKKAIDLKSQASTAISSNKNCVVQQQLPPDENSTVTCPATSELCSDHFDTNSERKQDQNQTSDSTLDKQVPCSSSCNLNQGSGGESKIIHPRRRKRQSLEEYVQSLGTNNHQAKTKKESAKSDNNREQEKGKGNDDKEELVKEQRGKMEPNNPGKSLDADLNNKTTTTKKTEDIPELDVQGKRKRKSVELYIPERIRPKKKKKPVESTIDSTGNKENIDDEGVEVGDVGYAFKKWFSAPYAVGMRERLLSWLRSMVRFIEGVGMQTETWKITR